MVCSTKKAASTLAHKRWGTKRKKSVKGRTIKEKEKEAPGVRQRRKSGQPSTHFENVVADLERRHGSSKPVKKPKSKSKRAKINVLVPRRK